MNSYDGEEGYPGNLTLSVTYGWSEDNELSLLYEASTDADTIGNTADNCAEAGVVARVIFHGIEIEADVRHFSVAVRNHDLYETAAEIDDFHISAVCVLHMVYINIFSCV